MGSNGTGRNGDGTGITELMNFFKKQDTALDAMYTHRYVLYGGSRGPGKSYWLRWSMLFFVIHQLVKNHIPGVKVGLFCEDYPTLKDRQISKITKEFPLWIGEVKSTQEDGLGFFLRENLGSGMIALRNLDKPEKYQSAEFAAVGVDELTKNLYDTFNILRGSMRWPGIEHTVFAGATNPGDIGHMWVKGIWIDRIFPPELRKKADQFKFIRALPADNPYLAQSYWDELNSLPEPLRTAWVDGDWDVFVGQALPAWRHDRHVVEPFEIPAHWPRWRAVDWGFSSPFCCLWFAKDTMRNRTYIYREAYGRQLSDREQALLIKDMTYGNIELTYADPSMWQSREYVGLTTSTADEYMAEGVPLTRADNDRLSGKRKVDRLLMDRADGYPGLQIFSTCKNLIRTLPALPFDETRTEDVDTDAEDHGYDALRYGLSRETSVLVRKEKPQRSPLSQMAHI